MLKKLLRIMKRDGFIYTAKRIFAYIVAKSPFQFSFPYYKGTRLVFSPSLLTYAIFAAKNTRSGDVKIITDYLNEGSTMIDVGANIGSLTIAAAEHVGPTGKVLTFEPSPKFARIIKQNITCNGFEDRVAVHQVALGASTGTIFLNENVADDTTNHISDHGTSVPQAPLNSFTKDLSKIDLLKIDVEGYEVEVLRGASAVLKKTAVIYIECNSPALERAGESVTSLVSLLSQYFTLYNKSDLTPFQLDPNKEYRTDLIGYSPLHENQA